MGTILDRPVVVRLPQREIDEKRRPDAHLRRKADVPTMLFHNGLRNAQAQARSAPCSRVGRIGLRELLKDTIPKDVRDTRPMITHRNAHVAFSWRCG